MRGAGLLPFLWVLALTAGCQGATGNGGPANGEELEALGLSSGAELHLVTLGGRGSEEHAVPTRIEADPGDGVEFRTVDHRVHTVSFIADSLSPAVLSFLESTGQLASPPLVTRGSRFIVRLQNAPSGRYFFLTEGHGGTATGLVEVGPPSQPDSTQS